MTVSRPTKSKELQSSAAKNVYAPNDLIITTLGKLGDYWEVSFFGSLRGG